MAPALRQIEIPYLRRRGWLSLLPALTVALFLLPVLAGVIGTLLPALGFLPGVGERTFSFRPLRVLLAAPELPGAVIATLVSGLLATLLAFLSAVGLAASLQGTRLFVWLGRLTVPLLAMPHAALAIGFAFLIAPSGWLVRLAAPLLLGDALPDGQASRWAR